MIKITINGIEQEFEPGITILEAARRLEFILPTFCNHPLLQPVASCRVCLVQIEGIPRLQPACATRIAPDMVIHTNTEAALDAQQSMLKLLLANHPLDCPICDKGGECELQDKILRHGPRTSFFEENKRVFSDTDTVLNKVIIVNSNRCIQCQRCVRICDEVVGAKAIGIIGRGANCIETGFEDNLNSCDHCGNCIEVCPVGALMRRPYRYKARPWDLKTTETICPHCGTGCQISADTRGPELVRVKAKETHVLNKELLCAKGRFGIDFVDNKSRITTPMIRRNGELQPASWAQALTHIGQLITQHESTAISGIISPRMSNEVIFKFYQLFNTVFASQQVYPPTALHTPKGESWQSNQVLLNHLLRHHYSNQPLEEIIKAEVIWILGCNIDNQNPVSDYLLRRSLLTTPAQLFISSSRQCRLDSQANAFERLTNQDITGLLFGVQQQLSGDSKSDTIENEGFADKPNSNAFVSQLSKAINNHQRMCLLVGSDVLTSPSNTAMLDSLLNTLAEHNPEVSADMQVDFQVLWRESNQLGQADMSAGWPMPKQALVNNLKGPGVLYLVDQELPQSALEPTQKTAPESAPKSAPMSISHPELKLIYQGAFTNQTMKQAEVVLPGCSFAETSGSFTNNEGRVQLVRPFYPLRNDARHDSVIFALIADELGRLLPGTDPAVAFAELSQQLPPYRHLAWHQLDSATQFRQNVANGNGSHKTEKLETVTQVPAFQIKALQVSAASQDTDRAYCLLADPGLLHHKDHHPCSPLMDAIEADTWVELHPEDAAHLDVDEGELLEINPHQPVHQTQHQTQPDRQSLRLTVRITPRAAINVLMVCGNLHQAGLADLLNSVHGHIVTATRLSN